MIYQPPTGARDLFPLDVAQKSWIEARIQPVFQRWGYHRIITSTLERIDTLMAGGAIERSTVIQVQGVDQEFLGLRPELTASIARAAATRMARSSRPQRFYYNANVFRRSPGQHHNRQHEFYQAGAELLGSGGLAADAEMLLLLFDCLSQLALESWCLVLGEAGLTQSLLSVFPAHLRDTVRWAIAHLDRMTLESLPLTPEQQAHALMLLDLRGHPADVLQRVSSLDLNPEQRTGVNNLKSLVEILSERLAALESGSGDLAGDRPSASIVLDLSVIRTFDYYTGIVFEVVSTGTRGQRVIGQGGRYDQLLGLYHPQGKSEPGIGFTLDISELHQILLPTGQLPAETSASDWLVVPTRPQAYSAAFAHADRIRTAPTLVRVEVYLDEASDREAVRAYAQQRRIRQIAWVDGEGQPEVEAL
jgi:ATP phosphoribosyltransferase regulatory subunit